jgi:type VI protein secretion system component VasF
MDVATDERARQGLQELLRSIGTDLSLLIRQQVALAKEEMRGIAAEKATGGALLAAAAVFALFVLGFASLARPRWTWCCPVGPRCSSWPASTWCWP